MLMEISARSEERERPKKIVIRAVQH